MLHVFTVLKIHYIIAFLRKCRTNWDYSSPDNSLWLSHYYRYAMLGQPLNTVLGRILKKVQPFDDAVTGIKVDGQQDCRVTALSLLRQSTRNVMTVHGRTFVVFWNVKEVWSARVWKTYVSVRNVLLPVVKRVIKIILIKKRQKNLTFVTDYFCREYVFRFWCDVNGRVLTFKVFCSTSFFLP